MWESLIRELEREQDNLGVLIPKQLFIPWAEANEAIINWIEEYIKS